MRIRIIGGGWYGCHLALALDRLDGVSVELWEAGPALFGGASGANPARLHKGFHYPRSRLTRAACLDHAEAFERTYGALTRAIPVNIYAVAAEESLVDYGTYRQVLRGEVDFIEVLRPEEFGLRGVEGAVLTGERHIVIAAARSFFQDALAGMVRFNTRPGELDSPEWDMTIDCTFCALDAETVDRYEPCVVGLLEGPTDRAVTIMDGPFPSIYPWDEGLGLSSISSAKWTPLSKACRSYEEAKELLEGTSREELELRVRSMQSDMARFWPASKIAYKAVELRTAIRAMPKSGADARLVDVVRVGDRAMRVRAGKIDAIFRAEALVKEALR